ncbi:MAG: VOC family protein [Gemmatimonadota bacterium]|nr:VOC family protein [Gemmatimonadota bacterium]
MPNIDSYLMFDGTCAEAMRFYEKTLGGKLEMMTQADAPPSEHAPPGSGDRILHARLVVDGRMLMASDWMAGQAYPGMSGFAISLVYATVPEGKKVFDALAQGGQVTMPFGKTFWVEGFGMVTDRFGTPWMVNGGKPSA